MENENKAAAQLPKDVTLTNGSKVRVNAFQGKAFIDAQTEALKQGITDSIETVAFMLSKFCTRLTDAGPVPLTSTEVEDLDAADVGPLSEWMGASLTEKTKLDNKTYAKLPSGRSCVIRRATMRDMIQSGKRYGENNRAYAMILLTTEVDGKALDLVDVQTMDGLDFVAINNWLNSVPS